MSTKPILIGLRRYKLALVRPMVTAKGSISHRSGIIVELNDGQHRGYGDAAPLAGWSPESLSDAEKALHEWQSEANPTASVAGLKSIHAAGAVADAQASFRAACDGVALHRLLHRESRDEVSTNAVLSGSDLVALEREAAEAIAAGFTTIKLKVAVGSVAADVERVRLVRSFLGSAGRLRIDANGGWSADDAVAALRALEEFDLEYCEDPVADFDELARVRRSVAVPIALDAPAANRATLDQILGSSCADVVILKPALLGGAQATLDLAGRVSAAGMTAVVTTFVDSVVGRTIAAHVAGAIGTTTVHGLSTGRLLAGDLLTPAAPEGPTLVLGDEPGLGINLPAMAGPRAAP